MSECTHNCSTCGESCGERTSPQSFLKKPHADAHIGKVFGVVSGKGGDGKAVTQPKDGQVFYSACELRTE